MLNFMVSPDYLPQHFGAWYLLNSYLQQQTGQNIRLHMPGNTAEMHSLFAAGRVHLAYVNPFEAARLIRQEGYLPLLKPKDKYDEMVVVCHDSKPYINLEDVPSGCRIAFADNEEVHLIGMRLLEGFGLYEHNTQSLPQSSQAEVLSELFHDRADVGFLLVDMFNSLSEWGEAHFRPLIRSRIRDIFHLLLLHPDAEAQCRSIGGAFLDMNEKRNRSGQLVLQELGLPDGFVAVEREEVEFMMDLMETLKD